MLSFSTNGVLGDCFAAEKAKAPVIEDGGPNSRQRKGSLMQASTLLCFCFVFGNDVQYCTTRYTIGSTNSTIYNTVQPDIQNGTARCTIRYDTMYNTVQHNAQDVYFCRDEKWCDIWCRIHTMYDTWSYTMVDVLYDVRLRFTIDKTNTSTRACTSVVLRMHFQN